MTQQQQPKIRIQSDVFREVVRIANERGITITAALNQLLRERLNAR